jgi:methylphosphotriester-DNA--protein-cysteine methyltransferase
LIAEKDERQVAEVIVRFAGAAEPAAAELSQRCLITHQNQAAVSEFIKRAVRRFLLKANGLSGDELGRVLGVDHLLARRIMKGTRNLTVDHIKVLVDRLMVNAGVPRRVMGS